MRLKKRKAAPKSQKNKLRSFLYDLIFGVTVAVIVRWAIFTPYRIPTGSMEDSLLAGDFVIVSKINYGARLPITPLQLPLTDKYIWGSFNKSYLDWIKLPYLRLPGFQKIKNNDVIVFNYPAEITDPEPRNPFPSSEVDLSKPFVPADLKTSYIKRCIGIPGDSIAIKKQVVYVNGKAVPFPQEAKFSYKIVCQKDLSNRFLDRHNITDIMRIGDGYITSLTDKQAQKFERLDFVDTIIRVINPHEGFQVLGNKGWSIDDFGPVYIPKKGDKIKITAQNFPIYENIILYYEDNKTPVFKDGKLYIDNKIVKVYTFKYNYYFAMGDNRHNSLDSRYWGFIPENHIIGKGFVVWFSKNLNKGIFDGGIRWSRIFSLIK